MEKRNWRKNCLKKESDLYGKSQKERKGESQGFTFVETLAVLAISAVLTAGGTVSVAKIIATARKTAARNQIEQYSSALQTYFLDCGRFPTTQQGLWALWEKPVFYPIPEKWDGPYLERKPGVDPWGTNIEYISAEGSVMPSEVPAGLPYVLICYGADKQKGGSGSGMDIVSWE